MAVSDFVSSSFESGSMENMGKKTKHEKGAGSTPATVQLEKAGVPFKTYEYEHSNDHMDDGYGVEAAKKLGFDEHQVFKTLMADTGSERVVGVVPVSGHMDRSEGVGGGGRCEEGIDGRPEGRDARVRLCGRRHLAARAAHASQDRA